jgi:hypothetical protein
LHQAIDEAKRAGKELKIIGLEEHRSLSSHPLSAKKRGPTQGSNDKS